MMNVLSSSLKGLRDAIRSRELSAVKVTEAYLAQIEKHNPRLNAYVTMNERALERAADIDQRLARCGRPEPRQ